MENIIFCAVRSQYDYYQQFINGTNGLGDPKLSLSSNHGFSKYFFYLTNWLIRFEVRQLLFETLLSGCSYFFCKTENNNCNFSMLNYILKVQCKIAGNVTEHETSSFIPFKAIMKILMYLEKKNLITFVVLLVKNKNNDRSVQ